MVWGRGGQDANEGQGLNRLRLRGITPLVPVMGVPASQVVPRLHRRVCAAQPEEPHEKEKVAMNRPRERRRRETEAKRSEAELLYETLFNQFPDGILIIDRDGSFIDFNEAAHRDLGYSREEFAELRIADIDPVETPEEIQANIEDVLEKRAAEFEVKHRTKSGEIRDVQVITRVIRLSGRDVFCTIWRDITERTHAAAALSEAAARYKDLFENANDAIFVVDAELNYVDVNKRATEIFGYSREEFLGMSILDFIPPQQRAASEREFRKLREHGSYEKFSGKSCTKDGRWLDVEVSSSAIMQGGQFVGSRDIVRDVTERKRAEDALRASENLLDTIIQTEPQCVMLLDAEGRLMMMNRSGLVMIGADSVDQVQGKPCLDLVASEYHDAFLKTVDDVFKGISTTLEFEAVGLKGNRLRLETHAVPLRNEGNEITALLALTQDITQRKKLEDELLRAQKLESVGLLAGGIAHDFNNLLTGILGHISVAQMDPGASEDIAARLRAVETACRRAQDLTGQLLTFARGGAPVKTTTSVGDVVREAAHFALRGFAVRSDLRIPDDLRPVDVDVGQFSQVIHNLVINADQAMPGGGTVTIACENVSLSGAITGPPSLFTPGDYVLITVKDQGIGIPSEHLSKIFDPYFTTKQAGSGLGLSSSYSIIKRHGGYITVDSELGDGATFSIYLPASRHEPPEPLPDQLEPTLGSGRILVMDDEGAVGDVAALMLERLGYEVAVARDGAEAMRIATDARDSGRAFDLAIVDLTVPGGLGGKEVVKELVTIDSSVGVIVSSGYSNDHVMSDYRQYGFAGVIEKPYTVAKLSAVVAAVLNDKR